MKYTTYILSLLFVAILFSCGSESATSTDVKNPVAKSNATAQRTATSQPLATSQPTKSKPMPLLFTKILDAHGGLAKWSMMNTLTYTKGEGAKAEKHTVDLKTRNSLIEVEGKFKLGNDGEKVWVTPSRDSFPGKSPRFVHNLAFYFVAIPFVLADPGVVYKDLGEQTINNKKYLVLETGFEANIGDAPEDKYILYVDPDTYLIDFINYSVTYFDASKGEVYKALKYTWSESNGLKFPSKLSGYKWENGQLGDLRYDTPYTNFRFSKKKMDMGMFEVPNGAYTE